MKETTACPFCKCKEFEDVGEDGQLCVNCGMDVPFYNEHPLYYDDVILPE